ncbi:RNA-directed DNA polymerase from mobile element jockey, partial [Stegodyphus mimosarum]
MTQGYIVTVVQLFLQHYLNHLEKWLTSWRIAVNTERSKTIIFRKGQTNFTPPRPLLFDVEIDWVDEVKYLGVIPDKKFTLQKHLRETEKTNITLATMRPLLGRRSHTPVTNKLILYKSILQPALFYASPVWGHAAKTHLLHIQVLQNIALREIINAPWFIQNSYIHHYLKVDTIQDYIKKNLPEISSILFSLILTNVTALLDALHFPEKDTNIHLTFSILNICYPYLTHQFTDLDLLPATHPIHRLMAVT